MIMYCFKDPRPNKWAQAFIDTKDNAKSILEKHGGGLCGIFITEFGSPTGALTLISHLPDADCRKPFMEEMLANAEAQKKADALMVHVSTVHNRGLVCVKDLCSNFK
ncbi:PREDICTED: uncharacterized protein LOC106817937 [Priapulus caudatus]|uniref:Uncharacterized protein LOC106817937 n=1 Tax=Priapulus caudatus TaxID=37621 RepID=A0ABM1F110_PRICU|nr:PREDICTED: uncharacterized protein LOC106817937 [Priapulus caudatus]